jgi:enterochelin esterase-like enzyme
MDDHSMDDYSKDDALAFIEAMRRQLEGRPGFKWFVERLATLAGYVEGVTEENERMRAFLESAGLTERYERFTGEHRP